MPRDAFGGRVLPFDREAAREYLDIVIVHRSVGRPVVPADGQIAAIAHSRGMTATIRSVRELGDIGVDTMNAWTAT